MIWVALHLKMIVVCALAETLDTMKTATRIVMVIVLASHLKMTVESVLRGTLDTMKTATKIVQAIVLVMPL